MKPTKNVDPNLILKTYWRGMRVRGRHRAGTPRLDMASSQIRAKTGPLVDQVFLSMTHCYKLTLVKVNKLLSIFELLKSQKVNLRQSKMLIGIALTRYADKKHTTERLIESKKLCRNTLHWSQFGLNSISTRCSL